MIKREALMRDTSRCFGCGEQNPIGLKLHMHIVDDKCVADFTPRPEHASYGDRMHGGLTSTLLDEVMGDYVFHLAGKPAYTAKLDIRFRSAVIIGETVHIEGWVTAQRGRLFVTEGRVYHADGSVAAEATGKIMVGK
ncbi:PaaI family thioesterase [uncultured Megasphaera sp.]|uniref:PaaI family thioesterase n=1 Tax=uncultured Megasphaera sp. TaxID=165188 RepID=UPI002657CF08|nr:PaaI family thioesterase [uncultured Megasphaera sp.]